MAVNQTMRSELARRVAVAGTSLARWRGLLAVGKLAAGEALLITRCRGIHTFLMSCPIDAIFLDKGNVVVATKEGVPPNRCTRFYLQAASVLELPAGQVAATATKPGHQVTFGADGTAYDPSVQIRQ